MNRILTILGIFLVLLCGLGGFLVKNLKPKEAKSTTVIKPSRRDLQLTVVETGTIDALKSVEVKSRVSGRLARLNVDVGDYVTQGQLIAVIDPKETALKVKQDRAQLRGAVSSVERQRIELSQRRVTALASYKQAQRRLDQLQAESEAQPILTNSAITQSKTALETAIQERERLLKSSQPSQRASNQASLAEAKSNYDTAVLELRRQEELLTKDFTSQRSVEQAKQNVDVAKARLESASETFNRLEASLTVELRKADENIRQARADLDRARANSMQNGIKRSEYMSQLAEVEKARAALSDVAALEKGINQSQASADQISAGLQDSERQLSETELRAPISGIVTKKLVQEGELVASISGFSAGTSIVLIEDRSTMRVKLEVNEIDTAQLKLQMAADITIDALPDRTLKGKVIKIAPSSTASAASSGGDPVVKYQVEVRIEDKEERLRSGMSARCAMITQSKSNVLTLPLEYVVKTNGKYYAEKPKKPDAKPDDNGERVELKTGLATGTYVEILGGATEKDEFDRPKFSGPKRKGFIETDDGNSDDAKADEKK